MVIGVGSFRQETSVDEYNTKSSQWNFAICLDSICLDLGNFSTAEIGFTGGYGMDFRAFMLTLISMTASPLCFQVTGFFVRRVVLQDKEYSYGRSFEKSLDAYPSTIYHLLCLLS